MDFDSDPDFFKKLIKHFLCCVLLFSFTNLFCPFPVSYILLFLIWFYIYWTGRWPFE